MTAYNQLSHRPQEHLDPVEELSLDDEIVSSAFWRLRTPEDYGTVMARSAVLAGYERGSWGATEAFNALVEFGLFGTVTEFMGTYLAGVRAKAAEIEPDISVTFQDVYNAPLAAEDDFRLPEDPEAPFAALGAPLASQNIAPPPSPLLEALAEGSAR